MAIYFISDLHLRGEQPHLIRLFEYFTEHLTQDAEAVYILGDLFEVWLGDDMILPDYQPVMQALHKLSQRNFPVYVMYGNRDFLMRESFCQMTGTQLLMEPAVIDLYGTPTLLMHGDTLCSDDVRYQQFRTMVRNPQFQSDFLAKSPEQRLALVKQYRQMSKTEMQYKADDIMDVNTRTVNENLRLHKVTQLIHGHTHRPAIHTFTLDGKEARRIVLSDWQQHGHHLRCTSQGCEPHTFELPH